MAGRNRVEFCRCPAKAVSCKSWSMDFVIQAVDRQGGGRPSYRAYSGRADNAAGGWLGAKTAAGGLQDTA